MNSILFFLFFFFKSHGWKNMAAFWNITSLPYCFLVTLPASQWWKRKTWNLPLCRIQRVITFNWLCSQAFISLCTVMLCTYCQCLISGERDLTRHTNRQSLKTKLVSRLSLQNKHYIVIVNMCLQRTIESTFSFLTWCVVTAYQMQNTQSTFICKK